MENLKDFQLTLWEDKLISKEEKFKEKLVLILADSTSDSLTMATNIEMKLDLHDINSLTFDIYTKYFDIYTEDWSLNEVLDKLNNEAHLKLRDGKEWYDFIVKEVRYNKEEYKYQIKAIDYFVEDLSKIGYKLEFNDELANNYGTAIELARQVVDGTDWLIEESEIHPIRQTSEEPLYWMPIPAGKYRSYLHDDDSHEITLSGVTEGFVCYSASFTQEDINRYTIIYKPGATSRNDYEVDANGIILNSEEYNYYYAGTDKTKYPIKPKVEICATHKANRLIYSPLTIYDTNTSKNVMLYTKDGDTSEQIYYGYTDAIYPLKDTELVANIIVNDKNFTSSDGWYTSNFGLLSQRIKATVLTIPTTNTKIDDWISDIKNNVELLRFTTSTAYNRGLSANAAFLCPYNSKTNQHEILRKGTKFNIRFKTPNTESFASGWDVSFQYSLIGLDIGPWITYLKTTTRPVKDSALWYKWEGLEINQDITYQQLLRSRIKIEFPGILDFTYATIEEIQVCKDVRYLKKGPDGEIDYNTKYIAWPGDALTDAASVFNRYNFYPAGSISLTDVQIGQINGFSPIYDGNYSKVRGIKADKTNRFDIIQTINETFECWDKFEIGRNSNGTFQWEDHYFETKDTEQDPKKIYYLDDRGTQVTTEHLFEKANNQYNPLATYFFKENNAIPTEILHQGSPLLHNTFIKIPSDYDFDSDNNKEFYYYLDATNRYKIIFITSRNFNALKSRLLIKAPEEFDGKLDYYVAEDEGILLKRIVYKKVENITREVFEVNPDMYYISVGTWDKFDESKRYYYNTGILGEEYLVVITSENNFSQYKDFLYIKTNEYISGIDEYYGNILTDQIKKYIVLYNDNFNRYRYEIITKVEDNDKYNENGHYFYDNYNILKGHQYLPIQIDSEKEFDHYRKLSKLYKIPLDDGDKYFSSKEYIYLNSTDQYGQINILEEEFPIYKDKLYIKNKFYEKRSRMKKKIIFSNYVCDYPNFLGFSYGVNINSIHRTIDSKNIVTKLIVADNNNEFGKGGTCSIARATDNITKSHAIYNFDYYINMGMLNADDINIYLYGDKDTVGYFSKYSDLSNTIIHLQDELMARQADAVKINSKYQVAVEKRDNAEDEIYRIKEKLIQLLPEVAIDIFNLIIAHALPANTSNIISYLLDLLHQTKLKEEAEVVIATSSARDDVLAKQIKELESNINYYTNELNLLDEEFERLFHSYIKEGTWNSDDYYDDNKYYYDALSTSFVSKSPQTTYDINIVDIGQLQEYAEYQFKLGDITYIFDEEMFGTKREEIVIASITKNFSDPSASTITVQNYKTKFADLFKKFSVATTQVQRRGGAYEQAANLVTPDRTLNVEYLNNTLRHNAIKIGEDVGNLVIDENSLTSTNFDGQHMVKIIGGDIAFSNNAGGTWNVAINADGINADFINAGLINVEKITIGTPDKPNFKWNKDGIFAYGWDDKESLDGRVSHYMKYYDEGLEGFKVVNDNNISIFKLGLFNQDNYSRIYIETRDSFNPKYTYYVYNSVTQEYIRIDPLSAIVPGYYYYLSNQYCGLRLGPETGDAARIYLDTDGYLIIDSINFRISPDLNYIGGWNINETSIYKESEQGVLTILDSKEAAISFQSYKEQDGFGTKQRAYFGLNGLECNSQKIPTDDSILNPVWEEGLNPWVNPTKSSINWMYRFGPIVAVNLKIDMNLHLLPPGYKWKRFLTINNYIPIATFNAISMSRKYTINFKIQPNSDNTKAEFYWRTNDNDFRGGTVAFYVTIFYLTSAFSEEWQKFSAGDPDDDALIANIEVKSEDVYKGTASGSGDFAEGIGCILTASPKEGYKFKYWEEKTIDDETGQEETEIHENWGSIYTYIIELKDLGKRKVFTAYFEPISYTITMKVNGNKGGSVTSSGAVKSGESFSITATPNEHYTFNYWKYTQNGKEITDTNLSSRIVDIKENIVCTAYFTENTKVTIKAKVSVEDEGGSVNPTETTIYSGGNCTLTATPDSLHEFSHWSKDNSSETYVSSTLVLENVIEDSSYTAHFGLKLIPHTLKVESNNLEYGTVSGGGMYYKDAVVTINAIANSGYRFVQWNDGNTEASREITMGSADITYIAEFGIESYKLTVVPNDENWGNTSGSGVYHMGDPVSITASPNEGYQFIQWNDGILDNPRNLNMPAQDITYIAEFSVIE